MISLSLDLLRALPVFDYQPRTRMICGADAVERVGEIARDLGGRRALLVTDPGIVAAGHAGRALGFIAAAGLQVETYSHVRENPTTEDVARCVEAARATGADLLIGLGGGSSMDTAKGANFILSNGGEMRDYWGVGKATKPMLPLIAIPTTAGTGSECQCAALIADETTHKKMACLDPKAAARVAILDPLLTVSQPAGVTACTGIDALAHALETAVSRKRTFLSAVFSKEAFSLCSRSLQRVMADGSDVEARANMQLGAAFAGVAIENAMLGAAHAAANPLTASHGIVHGHAVGIMLLSVIRFNAEQTEARRHYDELATAAGLEGTEELLVKVEEILVAAGMRGVVPDGGKTFDIAALAAEAAEQWTAAFNPRPITAEDFQRLYENALHL